MADYEERNIKGEKNGSEKRPQTKDRLLALLEAHLGSYLSGEDLADSLQVSRTAIWKAIQALKHQGYRIDSVTNRGYCLSPSSDVMTKEGIEKLLEGPAQNLDLILLEETGSTNAYLRQLAGEGASHGTVVIAEKQTAGRGRMGRSFFSPSDTGVYLSLLLRPAHELPSRSVKMTTLAAVSACEAMEQFPDIQPRIKWVNDLFVHDRKIAGILTEGSFNMETGTLDFMVVGIGFNVYPPTEGFPEEIRESAGALFSARQPNGKNRLVSGFLNSFFRYYEARDLEDHADSYRRRSMILGKEIEVLSGESSYRAAAKKIDEECRLIVELEDGSLRTLSSGEVRILPVRN